MGVNSRLKDDKWQPVSYVSSSSFLIIFLRLELLFPVSWPNSALCLAGVPQQPQTDAVFLCFLPLPVRAMPDVVSQLLFSSPEVVSAQGWVEPSLRMGGAKISHAINTSWDTTKHPILLAGLPQGWAVRPVPLAQKAAMCEGDERSSMANPDEQRR